MSGGLLSLADLRAAIADPAPGGGPPPPGGIDEVIVATVDLPGRLVGTGLSARFFCDEAAAAGLGACRYLWSTDVEMNTDDGYGVAAWREGFGDLWLRPDLGTLRRAPWLPSSAVVLADPVVDAAGTPLALAPRQVLRRQLDRLAAAGLTALVGTELEFLVFTESYRAAAARDYGGLTPASRYNIDYALTGTEELDDLVRRLRRAMSAAGIPVESARAEVHPGQYEITFRYTDPLRACDQHVLYKTTAKRLAAAAGQAITFMAKYDQGEGSSCHVHLSLRRRDGSPAFAAAEDERGGPAGGRADTVGMSALFQSFLAGQLACLAEFTLLFAPNVNSYKRLAPGAFAPVGIAWGRDNRTCALRVVGAGPSLRFEHRVPGGDANPYLAVAGIIAAGLHGIEHGLPLEPARAGNAFADPAIPRLPATLDEAVAAWRSSAVARAAFGDDVVD
ncbi:MAG: glutamine synthetase, partial [Frankia sp.]|nr:glutamine synthetase [Frankia sp.]